MGSITASAPALQGIQFLIENDLLKNTCEDIAQFLYKGEGLNKTAIGDYLGERYGRAGALLGCPPQRQGLGECCWVLESCSLGARVQGLAALSRGGCRQGATPQGGRSG